VYNRPWHTARTLQALSLNILADQSELYIFCDGAKKNAGAEERKNIAAVRDVIREKQWCKEVFISEADENSGLAASVKTGLSQVLEQHDRAIVLEDDLETSSGFLVYMNECLDLYKNRPNVWSVTGHMFPLGYPQAKCVLLPYISTWGWGTWREKWKSFTSAEPQDTSKIINSQEMKKIFNLSDYDYAAILKNNYETSWGIQWYFHVFINHGLSVYPSQSLVRNIGRDGSGTHYVGLAVEEEEPIAREVKVAAMSAIDLDFWSAYLRFFTGKKSIRQKLLKNVFARKS
jgi:hypothetical protein